MTNDDKNAVIAGVIGAAVLAFVFVAFSCFEIVDPGFRGVKTTFGEVDQQVYDEGFHMKWPWQSITEIGVKQQLVTEEVSAASSDLQTVFTEIAVNYYPIYTSVPTLYQTVGQSREGWVTVLLDPAINEVTKAVAARFTAEDLIRRRADAKKQITAEIVERMVGAGLAVVDVSIKNFRFGKAFERAIESKQVAEQNSQRAKNELEKARIDAQQEVAHAEANKQSRILAAEANAEEIRIQSEADAERIARLSAVQAAAHKLLGASVNDRSLRVRFLEKWNGVLPKVVGEGNVFLQLGLEEAKEKR